MRLIPKGKGIDQLDSTPIPGLQIELELKDFIWQEVEQELELN